MRTLVGVASACGAGSRRHGSKNAWMTNGVDPWDVFVCHVPTDTKSAVYEGLLVRLALRADGLSTILNEKVGGYFTTLSDGHYRPQFTAAGDVSIAATDEPQACIDKALAAASPTSHGVLVVADAEHNGNQPGGFGSPGDTCADPPCAASTTRRSAYVGAADFDPQWGDQPPMDLVEHRSVTPSDGLTAATTRRRRSHTEGARLDEQQRGARAVHPDRRDAPDTLAINRLEAGWLPVSAVAVIPAIGRDDHALAFQRNVRHSLGCRRTRPSPFHDGRVARLGRIRRSPPGHRSRGPPDRRRRRDANADPSRRCRSLRPAVDSGETVTADGWGSVRGRRVGRDDTTDRGQAYCDRLMATDIDELFTAAIAVQQMPTLPIHDFEWAQQFAPRPARCLPAATSRTPRTLRARARRPALSRRWSPLASTRSSRSHRVRRRCDRYLLWRVSPAVTRVRSRQHPDLRRRARRSAGDLHVGRAAAAFVRP